MSDVKASACVDPKRIYADGYSMGGGMSHYLACNAADVFAAVAPSAFDLLTEEEEPCPSHAPDLGDLLSRHRCFSRALRGRSVHAAEWIERHDSFFGAEGTLMKWGQLNGCTGTAMDIGNGCQTYSQCKEGTEVTLCTTQGGGHDPGDAKRGWETLKKHPMP